MSNIALKDILIGARQEAYRMRHFYLGVEHLFIALLEIKGGLAASILEEHGLTPEYVIDALRRKVSKGGKHRLWAGIPNTPRADVVLGIAGEIALEQGRKSIVERDILIAILEEGDNVPTRLLQALGLDLEKLKELARHKEAGKTNLQSFVKIDFGPHFDMNMGLTKDQLFILRRMFQDYPQIRVENQLKGGYTSAIILIVTPIHADRREDTPVVVKIGDTDAILEEARRYESYVKGKLPPLTARLEDKTTAPDVSDLAGIKYTLMADEDGVYHDLRSLLPIWGARKMGQWIAEKLHPTFGKTWWGQSREYRFEVWREYDWMLPPIFTLELTTTDTIPNDAHILRFPIKRSKLKEIEYGDLVVIENFIVKKVDRERSAIQLGFGQSAESANAFKIEIRNIDFNQDTYFRGEVVERIVGRVWKTRDEQLTRAARRLGPDFDIESERIPFGEERLPNPIIAYAEVLDEYHVNATMSTIHGDLHLGNILVGPNESPSLVDFAHTRDGHTLFDWAILEISLLSDVLLPYFGESWDDARRALTFIAQLNAEATIEAPSPEIEQALEAIRYLRQTVAECLFIPNQWAEYYVALSMCCLRAISWDTMSFAARRLLYLVAALAIHELRGRHRPDADGTPSPDDTGLSTNP